MLPSIMTQFPAQRKATSAKTDKWAKECIDAAINLALYNDYNNAESKEEMQINIDLYNGILNKTDSRRIMDPWELGAKTFPDEVQIYSIAKSKIDLLVGEESRRKFDWRVRVTNEDAISEKEEMIKQRIVESLMATVMRENLTEEEAEQEIKKLDKWKKYEAQDFRERLSSQILTHLYQEQLLKVKFNQGLKDGLRTGMEIYHADIIGKKPILRRVDPRTLFFTGLTESKYIEDADMIVEDVYMSPGSVIDYWYDELKPGDIDRLQRGYETPGDQLVNYPGAEAAAGVYGNLGNMSDGSIDLTLGASRGSFNHRGEVRVQRVSWKSLRKLGWLKYYDQDGLPVNEVVDENYKIDPTRGEEVEWLWVNEWWSGIKIADDIYIKVGPNPVQFRRMDNLSICGSGYVGTIYGERSMMSMMRPFEYMFSFLMHRLKKAYARFYGPMVEVDFAKMPDNWTPEKWLMWAQELGYLVVDSFTEGQKGAAQGKLAGTFNTTGKVLNVDLSQYIQQTIGLLHYIEEELGSVVGITRQREGTIENRETVGGVERSVTQSSHITEEIFLTHDNTKLRALQALLEVAKFAYKDVNNKVAQYILDGDLSQTIFRIDGEKFAEADYGLVLTDATHHTNMMQVIQSLAQAGLQNNKLNFSAVMDIYLSSSFTDARKKIEQYEEEADQKAMEMQQMQQEHEQQMLEREIENKEDMQSNEKDNLLLQRETAIILKTMELEAKIMELEAKYTSNDDDSKKSIEEIKLKEIDLKEKIAKLEIESKERIAEKQNKSREKIESMKPKPTKK